MIMKANEEVIASVVGSGVYYLKNLDGMLTDDSIWINTIRVKTLHVIEDENLNNCYDFMVTIGNKVRLVSIELKNIIQITRYKVLRTPNTFDDIAKTYLVTDIVFESRVDAICNAISMSDDILTLDPDALVSVYEHEESLECLFKYSVDELNELNFGYVVVASITYVDRRDLISVCRIII